MDGKQNSTNQLFIFSCDQVADGIEDDGGKTADNICRNKTTGW